MSFTEKEFNTFRDYVNQGLSGNEIAQKMGLKPYQIKQLRTELMDAEKRYIPLEFNGGRGILTVKESGIWISSGRIRALRLDDIFKVGTELRLEKDGDTFIVKPISNSTCGSPKEENHNASEREE